MKGEDRRWRIHLRPSHVFQRGPGESDADHGGSDVEYQVAGRPAATYKAGDVLLVPAGTVHWVTNVGSGNGAELATYVVEKGKPLITLVK
jgi:hypothetical protein